MSGLRGSTRTLGRSTQLADTHLGPYLNRVIWSLAGLSTLFLGLRVYCKFIRRRGLWWDDHVLVLSWVALIVSIALQTAGTTHGLGRLHVFLNAEQIKMITIYSMSAGFGSILATCWSKTSFALSLLRISTGQMRAVVWFIIVTVNLVLGSNGLLQWIQCWPVNKRWDYLGPGTCFPPDIVQNYNTFVAAYSGFMDIVLAFLPWRIILTVAINKREKLGALVAMSVGVIAGLMAFLKIRTLYVIGNDNVTTVDLFIFGTAEPATSIMAASIPVLRTLLRREPQPRPARFIELTNNNRQREAPSSVDEPAALSKGVKPTDVELESWSKVSQLEKAHVPGHGYSERERQNTIGRDIV